MATIFSNANGAVVEAKSDAGETYYYVADGLGVPVAGAWRDRESALMALDCGEAESMPKPHLAMDDRGELLDEATPANTVKIRLGHRSSIPQARWATPVGWEPANEIEGSEFLDGSWWDETEETAGLVCFVPGDEEDEIDVSPSDLRVASTGNCRVIGPVEL